MIRKKLLYLVKNLDYYFNKFFPNSVKKVKSYYVLNNFFFKLRIILIKTSKYFLRPSLSELYFICGSDKYKNYSNVFDIVELNLKKHDKLKILEIGIGSHNLKNSGGASLIALSLHFKYSKVYGVDLFDKSFLDTNNIKTIIADQSKEESLSKLYEY